MKDFYLVKCKNNVPFILGQFDTREEAEAALGRERADTRASLQVVVDLSRIDPVQVKNNYSIPICDMMRVVEWNTF